LYCAGNPPICPGRETNPVQQLVKKTQGAEATLPEATVVDGT
jgi:hypothetical protein